MRPMASLAIPNNLGPTLLIALAVVLLPLGIGLPLLLIALARVRTWQGKRACPRLHRSLKRLAAPLRVLPPLPTLPMVLPR